MSTLTNQIIGVESGGNPNATNPNSSASGPGQFINSTWLSVLKQHRPDIAAGKTDSQLLALKNDPTLAPEMTADYAADNQAILTKNGLPVTPGTTYLAHFAGPQGAMKVLQADPNAQVADILGPQVVSANPFLKGMTAQDLQGWANRKMGSVTSATPNAQPLSNVNTNVVNPQSPPIFAGQAAPQQTAQVASPAPQQQNGALGALGSIGNALAAIKPPQSQPMAAPSPIFAPAPRPINLAGLSNMLAQNQQNNPIFSGNFTNG